MKPQGLFTVSKIVDAQGKIISMDDAVRYGWLPNDIGRAPRGWDVGREEACLGKNLFLDQGRQVLCYLLGGRAPLFNYACQNFGVGTGTTPPNATDVALQSPVMLNSGNYTGPVESIDYLSAFVMRVAFTLGLADANGFLLTEMGLFSGNNTLLNRKVRSVGISKTSDWSPTITFRLRL